jgi:hypothetical protein
MDVEFQGKNGLDKQKMCKNIAIIGFKCTSYQLAQLADR